MTNTMTTYRPAKSPDTAALKSIMFGCGNMGRALLEGWARADHVSYTVIDPAKPDLNGLAMSCESADALPETNWDLAIIAVKPQLIPTIMDQAGHIFRRADMVLSIAAGVSMNRLQDHVGDKPIVRMMPNMPASIGKGISGLFASNACTDHHKALIADMANRNGELIWLPNEDAIDRFTAIAGSGPGYVFEILRLYTLAAMDLGFDETSARKLVTQTVIGSAEMADRSEQTLEDLRKAVTSKNGTTEAGLSRLMESSKLETLLQDTVNAAYTRAVELR